MFVIKWKAEDCTVAVVCHNAERISSIIFSGSNADDRIDPSSFGHTSDSEGAFSVLPPRHEASKVGPSPVGAG